MFQAFDFILLCSDLFMFFHQYNRTDRINLYFMKQIAIALRIIIKQFIGLFKAIMKLFMRRIKENQHAFFFILDFINPTQEPWG